MNKKIVIIFIMALVSINCREKPKVEFEEDKVETNICFTKSEKEKIIKTILETPDFQMFLHPGVEGRLPIQLVKNEFVTPNLEIQSNGYAVVFVDSLILPYGETHRIRITDMDCKRKEIRYSVFYPIEGAIITGSISKSGTLWVAKDSNWGIKD